MKKLNNKGFAITTIVYAFLILFIALVVSTLFFLANRKLIIDKIRDDIMDKYNQKPYQAPTIDTSWNKMTVSSSKESLSSSELLDGIVAIDDAGNTIDNITYDLNIPLTDNKLTVGIYTITYTATDSKGVTNSKIATVEVKNIYPEVFNYIGDKQTYNTSKGTYKLEVWGAQGGGSYGAKGGYSVGTITVTENQKLYICVGGKGDSGVNQTVSSLTTLYGGYNGGGNGYMTATATSSYNSLQGGGGGATDIRLNNQTLSARVIVAGGGGGSGYAVAYSLGYGGGTSGGNGYTSNTTNYTYGIGGSQTGGGGISGTSSPTYSITEASSGTLGKGGDGGIGTTAVRSGSGGGGGYYGGGGGGAGASANIRGGGGGSGYTDYSLTNTDTIAGNLLMPNISTGTETGHTGNGNARITPLVIYK